jgi:hypothetical protein
MDMNRALAVKRGLARGFAVTRMTMWATMTHFVIRVVARPHLWA